MDFESKQLKPVHFSEYEVRLHNPLRKEAAAFLSVVALV